MASIDLSKDVEEIAQEISDLLGMNSLQVSVEAIVRSCWQDYLAKIYGLPRMPQTEEEKERLKAAMTPRKTESLIGFHLLWKATQEFEKRAKWLETPQNILNAETLDDAKAIAMETLREEVPKKDGETQLELLPLLFALGNILKVESLEAAKALATEALEVERKLREEAASKRKQPRRNRRKNNPDSSTTP